MAKRADEKERRRQERLEAERAEAAAASRRRTFQIGAGALVGVIVIAVVVLLLTAGGKGKTDNADAAQVATDAKAAGCTYKQYKSEGRTHVSGKVNSYKTNPPTSGPHNPVPAQDGIYAPGNSPAKESFVHSLEHGRIEFQYAKGTSAADQAKLKTLAESKFNGTAGYHTLLFENNTNMPAKFAATAWTRSLTCNSLSPAAIKAMTSFRQAFTDKGPEFIP